MKLITLKEAQEHLRIDSNDDQDYVSSLIDAASAMVFEYLDGGDIFAFKRDENGEIEREDGEPIYQTDSEDNKVIKSDIKAAVKLLVGDFYRHRENSKNVIEFGADKMPTYVAALLFPHRARLGV
jgi:hypothetical protein